MINPCPLPQPPRAFGRAGLFVVVLLLAWGMLLGSVSAEEPATEKTDPPYQRFSQLKGHWDGFVLDDAPEAPALLRREWWRIAHRAAAYLDRHPGASEIDVGAIIAGMGETLWPNAVRLDPRTFLIAVDFGESGSVFVLRREAGQGPGHNRGRYRIVWSIADARRHDPKLPALIGAWSPEKARESCRPVPPGESPLDCGPLSGSVGRLPDAGDGSPRFYVDATYAQSMGASVAAQLTIWKWTGGRAQLLYQTLFGYMIDQSEGDRFEGNEIRLREKDDFKSFFSCGACEGRQMDHVIRIEGDRIRDLGLVSAMPELDLVDDLLDRTLAGVSVADIADPDVAKTVKDLIAHAKEEDQLYDGGAPQLGMLMDSAVTREGPARKVCATIEALGTFLFTIEGKEAPRVTAVAEGCKD